MIVGLNATQARSKSAQDLTIYQESYHIMNDIILASAEGKFEVVVSNKSTMTGSQAAHRVVGTQQNPVIAPNATIIINSTTIVLGTSGTNLNAIIADINDAGLTGVVASKQDQKLVIDITLPQDNWTYDIGAGTANSDLGIIADAGSALAPSGVSYFDVWQGTQTNRALQNQMESVVRYFESLGYKIQRRSNITSGKTFDWYVFW